MDSPSSKNKNECHIVLKNKKHIYLQKIFVSLLSIRIFEYSELPKKNIYHIYGVIAFAALISFCSHVAAQTDASRITGSVINDYRKVTSINVNNRIVTFSGASVFKQKDTVLLIQMTGIQTGGTIGNTSAGLYEFHIVESAAGSTVTLKSTPGSFNASGELVQIVRVPSYKNAIIPSGNTLQCAPWSWTSGTGGVLALMIDETLTLQGNIDVSGLGFNGGAVSTIYGGECSFNPPYNFPNYPKNAVDRAGNKGEGAVTASYFNPGVSNDSIRGYGRTWNGGGGGNGKWSGGGGGANGGAGGNGDDQACGEAGFDMANYGGNNGLEVKYTEISVLSERAFMGGGGGAGTGIGTAGGNGGGIVILVAQKINFEGNAAIKANGGSVPEMPGMSDNPAKPSTAGAGGGGGGGSVLLSAADYGDIRVEITGGDGGSVLREYRVNCLDDEADSRGAGGGGGGGFLLTTRDTSGIGHKIKIGGGAVGRIANTLGGTCTHNWAGPGQNAICHSNFQVQMKGFFRNYIITPHTATCSGNQVTVEASQPQGGNGIFTCSWQSAPIGTDTWTDIPNADGKDLTYTITQSIRVRRKVISGGIDDFSSSITITMETVVNTAIAPADTTLCWEESLLIRGNMPTGGGGGPYGIQWQELKNNTWVNIDQATDLNLTVSLQAGGGDQTYRRQVTSAKACVSEGNTSVIHVQPLITNNTITPDDQKVCEDRAQKLTGPEPEGGAGSYQYYWQVKTEGQDWTDLSNPVTDADYQPILNTLQITGADLYRERSYRRFVESGTCQSQSNEVTIRFDQQSSVSNIETPGADQVGSNALKFQFSEKLDAEFPATGSGIWSSTDEKLSFNPPNEPSTTVSNLQLGNNTVVWTVSNGTCASAPDSVRIEVIDVTIPNGFSPNGDGINDCFRVAGGENAVTGEITVLDRYNNVVFESKAFKGVGDLDQCSGWWDGRTSSGKELPTGTYFYKLTLNGDKVYKGYVVLKKQ